MSLILSFAQVCPGCAYECENNSLLSLFLYSSLSLLLSLSELSLAQVRSAPVARKHSETVKQSLYLCLFSFLPDLVSLCSALNSLLLSFMLAALEQQQQSLLLPHK